jgi:hypothetical protein
VAKAPGGTAAAATVVVLIQTVAGLARAEVLTDSLGRVACPSGSVLLAQKWLRPKHAQQVLLSFHAAPAVVNNSFCCVHMQLLLLRHAASAVRSSAAGAGVSALKAASLPLGIGPSYAVGGVGLYVPTSIVDHPCVYVLGWCGVLYAIFDRAVPYYISATLYSCWHAGICLHAM